MSPRPLAGRPLLEVAERWPDVPVRFLLCREDRLFPAEWLRGVVRERLGIEADEIDAGHCVALSRPAELVVRLESYRAERAGRGRDALRT